MLLESALAAMVEPVIGCCLAEVALDGRHALLQQSRNLRLVPRDGLRIREVEHGILVGHTAIGIPDVEIVLYNLTKETVLRCEVG